MLSYGITRTRHLLIGLPCGATQRRTDTRTQPNSRTLPPLKGAR